MEGAFTHVGNHLVSDSASAINAGDDFSTIDADEAALDREYGRGNMSGGPRRRRVGDGDHGDAFEDEEDLDGMASAAANGNMVPQEEHVELPPHACAYCGIHNESPSETLSSSATTVAPRTPFSLVSFPQSPILSSSCSVASLAPPCLLPKT